MPNDPSAQKTRAAEDHGLSCHQPLLPPAVLPYLRSPAEPPGLLRRQARVCRSSIRYRAHIGFIALHRLDDTLASADVKLSAGEIASVEEPYVPHGVAWLRLI